MLYVLSGIRNYLITSGFSNIYINYAPEETNKDQTGKNRIVLMAEANSQQGNRVPTQRFNFTVYVRDADKETSNTRSLAVFNILKNYSAQLTDGGQTVTIHDIQGNPPYFWGIYPKTTDMTEYAMNMNALISNDDANYF